LTYDQLHESTLILVSFPRRRFLAGTHPNNDLAEANGFAGFHFKITGLSVALVQQADDGNSFGHRCADLLSLSRDRFVGAGGGFCFGFGLGLRLSTVAP
jgi:hypothetical protein